ncbi:uncharacterized protein LOC123871910 [Maniola jurtina]|uniref:uncharacterized protein LOC123871910 n=1 Tax=Maniola jurtina TaxID=191418 RepID=UPI001E689839|nr:uncharacterized protein LOC123871910 [Maniola jurtina]
MKFSEMDLLNFCVYIMISFVFNLVSSNVLESEQSSFLGLSQPVSLSSSTVELVAQLEAAVRQHARGDRRVRRYFKSYDTPFAGRSRRANRGDSIYDDY